jgi:hypothetical protein
MEERSGADILGDILGEEEDGICPMCGKETKIKVYLAKTY